ncbi:MAG: enoyl-CoA hydratase-related protein [Candidatus Sedimenticola sp. (ex Thyasira tokunagai)]
MRKISSGIFIDVSKQRRKWTITFNQPHRKNVISLGFLEELHEVLDDLENDCSCRLVVFQGRDGYFCTGMDFDAATDEGRIESEKNIQNASYMHLLKRISECPKVTLAKVSGKVMAGGIGIVTASDLVVASPDSEFSLPEALWGLLPACVTPFLIRRIGVHQAYRMVLTTETLCAEEAKRINLVDSLHKKPDEVIRQYFMRVERLTDKTTRELKSYFRKMWIFDDTMEKTAVDEINRLINDPVVQENIRNYAEHRQFPWDKDRERKW